MGRRSGRGKEKEEEKEEEGRVMYVFLERFWNEERGEEACECLCTC